MSLILPKRLYGVTPGSAELGDKFGDEEERISVLDGYGVQSTIVLD